MQLNYYGHSSSELCWRLMRQLEALSEPDQPGIVLLKAALFVRDRQNAKACQVETETIISSFIHIYIS